jgi:hypothetical protein
MNFAELFLRERNAFPLAIQGQQPYWQGGDRYSRSPAAIVHSWVSTAKVLL